MKKTYRLLAYVLAAEVVVQAGAIAFAIFGLFKFIDDGAVVDKASQESDVTFQGVAGFIVHGINGEMVIPALGLIMLMVSFFAKIPGGIKWAAILLALIVVQVLLGIFGQEIPGVGALHRMNALAVFAVALMAGHRVRTGPVAVDAPAGADWATV